MGRYEHGYNSGPIVGPDLARNVAKQIVEKLRDDELIALVAEEMGKCLLEKKNRMYKKKDAMDVRFMVRLGESYDAWYRRVVVPTLEYETNSHVDYRRLYKMGGLYIHSETYRLVKSGHPGIQHTELYNYLRACDVPAIEFRYILDNGKRRG